MERDKLSQLIRKKKNSFSEMSKIHEINPTSCEKEDTVLCVLGQCQKSISCRRTPQMWYNPNVLVILFMIARVFEGIAQL